MKKRKKQTGSKSLRAVRAFFPKVDQIVDADDPLIVEVTKKDTAIAERKEHRVCAFAVACKRVTHADGVVIGLTISYVIRGQTAVRYKNSEGISREITSFDRLAEFAEGVYRLVPAAASGRLGVSKAGQPPHPRKKNSKDRRKFMHFTTGVRTVLGQYRPPGMMK